MKRDEPKNNCPAIDHDPVSIANSAIPSLYLDADLYRDDLRDRSLSKEQEDELLQTLWNIMSIFVDIGCGVDTVQVILPELFKNVAHDSKELLESKGASYLHEIEMTETQEKVLIYCRVPDTKQKTEGSGLESQEFRCRQYAAEKGYTIESVFHDDVSGGGDFAKRPGMIALLNYLEKNKKSSYVVIFDDLKRLARDTMFHWQLRHAMANFGARLECLNYKFYDMPEVEFIETLFAAQAQLECQQIGRQTRQKTKARLEAGYHAFIAPVGFKYIKSKAGGKILVKDEPAASIIAEAMEGFASGRFQTKQEVRYFLEAAPEFPKTASGKISNNRADDILANPLYAGYVEYKPWGVTLRKGKHEGMVNFTTFQKIQERACRPCLCPGP
ncbi:MAG: recombinase family protein [Thiotrichaceae bacterium]|nr:recombinase family protein [Thiotrichaceae bacterium]